MRLRRPLPAVQGDTLHIVGVGDNRIGKFHSCHNALRLAHAFKGRDRVSSARTITPVTGEIDKLPYRSAPSQSAEQQ